MRILIAEDDITSRVLLTALLKKCDHEVLITCDGTEAWNILQKPDAPNLVILDWMMPGMDGIEVCRRLRAIETETLPYIILLTARSEKKDIIEGLSAGADDYLTKPFDAGELRARINAGCRIVTLQNQLSNKIGELREALAQIKTLRGIVPICASCKKIRDDSGYWNQVEIYVSQHSEAQFSHGICPECMEKLYPEFSE